MQLTSRRECPRACILAPPSPPPPSDTFVYGRTEQPRSTHDWCLYSFQWLVTMVYAVVWGYAIVGVGLNFAAQGRHRAPSTPRFRELGHRQRGRADRWRDPRRQGWKGRRLLQRLLSVHEGLKETSLPDVAALTALVVGARLSRILPRLCWRPSMPTR